MPTSGERSGQSVWANTEISGWKYSRKKIHALPRHVDRCTILVKPYISRSMPHHSLFRRQKYFQHSEISDRSTSRFGYIPSPVCSPYLTAPQFFPVAASQVPSVRYSPALHARTEGKLQQLRAPYCIDLHRICRQRRPQYAEQVIWNK